MELSVHIQWGYNTLMHDDVPHTLPSGDSLASEPIKIY